MVNKNYILVLAVVSFLLFGLFFVSAAPNFQGPGIINNTDNFYSPYETINFSITTATGPDNATQVQMDLTSISATACGGTGYFNLTNTSALNNPAGVTWIGGCAVSTFFNNSAITEDNPIYQIGGGNFGFIAYNSSGSTNISGIQGPPFVLMHNLGVPNLPLDPLRCDRFGNLTTNMSLQNDFAHVNFIIQIEKNGSCLHGPGGGSSPWEGYQQVLMVNFSSLNMTKQDIGQKLHALGHGAIQVEITPPHEWGPTSIYVNSTAFEELNTNTTITLNNLPFTGLPSITCVENASRIATGLSFQNKTPFIFSVSNYKGQGPANISVPRGDLTFVVPGFSTFDVIETEKPLITLVSPVNFSSSTVLVSATINGTGSDLSLIQITNLSGGANYIYNASGGDITDSANCVNLSSGTSLLNCTVQMFNVPDGSYTLTITANDFASPSPGNQNSTSKTILVDLNAPAVTINTPAASSWKNANFTINTTITDTSALTIKKYKITNSTGTYIDWTNLTQSGSNNYIATFDVNAAVNGNYTIYINTTDSNSHDNVSVSVLFWVDKTAPTLNSVSENPSTTSAVITYSASEAVNVSIKYGTSHSLTDGTEVLTGYDSSDTITLSDLTSGSGYHYNITICDRANNCLTNGTFEFDTDAEDDDSSGGSGTTSTSFWTSSFSPTDEQLQEGFAKLLKKGQRIRVKIGTESHYVGIISLTSTSATINISSTPQQAVFSVGETKSFEVNDDGYYDIKVRLNSVNSTMANITTWEVYEKMPAVAATDGATTGTTNGTGNATTTGAGTTLTSISEITKNKWFWIGLGAIVLVAVGAGYYLRKRKKHKGY